MRRFPRSLLPAALAGVITAFVATVGALATAGDTVSDGVLGQPNFTSNTPNNGGIGASSFDQPSGVAIDGAGHLFVADSANNRVLEYDSPLASQSANRVFGQGGSFATAVVNKGGISADSLNAPFGVALDASGRLYIADSTNNRVLEYDDPLASQTATRVFGQGGDFTANASNNGGIGIGSLSSPVALVVDGAGRLYVSDQNNSRVLEYDSPLNSQTANRVFGQVGSFIATACNGGGVSASTLCLPGAIALDAAGHLYVADLWNSRVLEYDSPLASQSANRVFGQGGSFSTSVINKGGVSAVSLNFAFGVVAGADGRLYVGDTQNNRILEYDDPLKSQLANRVFGQPNFTSSTANGGGIGPSTLYFPAGLAKDSSGDLYAADVFNHRLLVYDGVVAVTPPPVVVLVHGWDRNSSTYDCGDGFPDLQQWLGNSSNTGGHAFEVDCLSYRTREGVYSGAEDLYLYLQKFRNRGQVDLVVHSLGGLVARECIQFIFNCKDQIRTVTMLGTPNNGSIGAAGLCGALNRLHLITHGSANLDQAICDLVAGSNILRSLNVNAGPPSGIAYNLIAGNVGYPGIGPNDCIVSVKSVKGPFATDPLVFPASHMSGGVIFCKPPGEIDSLAIRQHVAQILLESNGFAPPTSANAGEAIAASVPPSPPPDEPAPSTIGSASGVITLGQVVDVPIVMSPGQATGTFNFRSPDDPSAVVSMQLYRPDSSQAFTDSPDVAYETGTGFGGLVESHYSIANPAPGTWVMRVIGTTVPPYGWPYDVEALVLGRISVTAGAGAGHYDVGQPFTLSADVAIGGEPYAGGSVYATVTKPNLSTADVPLTDAGGGSYTGPFSDTAACGLYQITVTADGSDNGTPFSRQDRTIAIAGVPGNMILDPCNADSDGDGLTDKDEINIYGTNPANADTDGDGYSDSREIAMGKNASAYCAIMRADVNVNGSPPTRGDGIVNVLDLLTVAKAFGPNRDGASEDQNADGTINSLDLLIVAQRFGQQVTDCA